jgi:predicted transcriptional regulator
MNSNKMDKAEEQILRAAKEIVVKFIETGRVSPTTFPETFRTVYLAIEEMVSGPVRELDEEESIEE